ncbi:MAG: hypothetical protein PHP52_08490 [Bacteroidales bacterium]|nr:hypothetical protein [Bacteroidales bacterium]MDD4217339.1 hypothetical protein [Bacteroidales bacterium]MDY0142054.1 hypothetical protein [Bacteroidales bacterium]
MSYFAAILTAVLIGTTIYFLRVFRHKGIKPYVFVLLFAAKIVGGVSVYGVYTYYYDSKTSDIHKFYKGGLALYDAANDDFVDYLRLVTGIQGNQPQLQKYYDNADYWTREFSYGLFNDNRTIMRANALFCLVSQGNIFIHIVLMAFLSFIGCFVLFKAFAKIFKLNKYLLILSAFLIPSCWFWTSGLMKEGLMMFAIGFAFWFLVKLYHKFTIVSLLGFIISCSLMFVSKIYVLPAFLPAVIFLFIAKKMNIKYQIITFFSILALSFVLVAFSGKLLGYDIISTLSGKQNDFINYIELQEDSGSTYDLTRLNPDVVSFIKIIPEGLINSFFRPFPSEVNSAFMLFSFLEIVLFCLICIVAIMYFKKPDIRTNRFILFGVMFILFLYVVVGVYTPNTGSIVRYRTPALPFCAVILFALIDWERIRFRILYFKK